MIDIIRFDRKKYAAAGAQQLLHTVDFSAVTADRVLAYHRTIPEYAPTPLISLDSLASELGVSGIYVKNESLRFGLNAFKALGGSYAIGCYLAEKLGLPLSELNFAALTDPAIHEKIRDMTFITATDGNHGRGVAWTASRLGVRSVVLMPKGSAPERLENIRRLGADARITDLYYDDTVRLAARLADENGWTLVQDTSWDGYEEIPSHIMQGYLTMVRETAGQMAPHLPTHIFLQAGVGSMAAAAAGFFCDYCKEKKPVITVVEPHNADCFYQTACAADGQIHKVGGSLSTEMAGLACGEPCPLAWNVLKDCADFYASVPDEITERGMRLLGRPHGNDTAVISGESGAVTCGLVDALLRDVHYTAKREMLGLGADSRILLISTEGDTDRANYARILADG